jgi:hypothetical protein
MNSGEQYETVLKYVISINLRYGTGHGAPHWALRPCVCCMENDPHGYQGFRLCPFFRGAGDQTLT